jgi:murein L,D-transpeptidase YcbB/YkuD
LRGTFLITSLCLAGLVSLGAGALARAENGGGVLPWERAKSAPEASPQPSETSQPPESAAKNAAPSPAEAEDAQATQEATPVPPHPVVAIIRDKLAGTGVDKDAETVDVAALRTFYGAWNRPPLWITDMGLSAKGQAALFEIQKADDWGLDAKAFALPDAGALPANPEAQASAEIKLDLAILKYARFARGGRFTPSEISDVLDQTPPLSDPQEVIAEIAVTASPGAYLQSLHPHHAHFVRLHQTLLKARDKDEGAETDEIAIRRIIINMERWRWLPEDLGPLYVWVNTPEFMLYVVKDGKTIFSDKTLVGTIGNPTPVFSADMDTIVFNPDWVAPPSILDEKLLPALRRKDFNILKANKLLVSYQGKRIDPTSVNWSRVDIHNFTFSQKAGPKNVLGKAKFLYPNKHVVYMHDTLPYRQKVFKEEKRDIGYGCVRMQRPRQFAELMLAEDKEWPASKVKDLWDKGVNNPVTLDKTPPVHTTYFTVVVDDQGKVATFGDLYGLDRKMAVALFGDAKGFPEPPPEPEQKNGAVASTPTGSPSGDGGFSNALGFLDN